MRPMRLRAWLAAASAVLAGAVSFAPAPRAETTTFVHARLVSDLGVPEVGGAVTLHSGAAVTTSVAPGGFFVLDGVLPGSRDRLVVLGSGLDFLGPTFFAGVKPVLDVPLLGADASSFSEWVAALDPGAA